MTVVCELMRMRAHQFEQTRTCRRYIDGAVGSFELFFEKHSDWASEAEYRWVFVNPEPSPVYLDVSDAITGIVLGDAFPEARLDAVYHLASRHDLDLKQVRFFNRWLHLMPVAAPPPREPPAHRREGSLEDRAQELAEAESKAEQASSLGAQLAAPIIAALWVSIAEQVATLPSVEVGIYDRATAIPLPERRRAPGVPTYSADYQRGVMCVVENLPRYSVTFVASAAVQTIADRSLKLHAAFEVERRRKDEPNERIELWRFASEGKPEAVAKLRDQFFAEITSHLPPALATFNELRSSGPSDD
jgi:hypothetical protein